VVEAKTRGVFDVARKVSMKGSKWARRSFHGSNGGMPQSWPSGKK